MNPSPPAFDLTAHYIAASGGETVVSVKQAAKLLGYSVDFLYDLCAAGRFPVIRARRADAKRDRLSVLIPALVQWQQDGGSVPYASRVPVGVEEPVVVVQDREHDARRQRMLAAGRLRG